MSYHRDRERHAVQFRNHVRAFAAAFTPAREEGRGGAPLWSTAPAEWLAGRFASSSDERAPRRATGILNSQAYAPAALACDAAVIVFAAIAAGAGYQLIAYSQIGNPAPFFDTGLLIAALFCGISRFKAQHLPFGTSLAHERARAALSSWAGAFAFFLFIAFTMKIGTSFSRGAILSFFVVGAAGAVVSRVNAPILMARTLKRASLAGPDVILAGPQNDPLLFRLTTDMRQTTGIDPCLVTFDCACGAAAWQRELQRTVEHVYKLAHGARPGQILVFGDGLSPERLSSLLEGLAGIPRSVCLVPDGYTSICLRQQITAVGNHVAVEVQSAPLGATERIFKRTTDIAGSLAALLVLAPLMAAIAIAIKLDSPGPVFFLQRRTGYRGLLFRIAKFRTMSVLEDGPSLVQAGVNDARVTRVGAFLRRSSLDELPQLFNVLMGHMSLVGPRPHAVAHDRAYERTVANYTLRQHVRPGITGWAQVNGLRGETATVDIMRRRVEYDIWYVRHSSLLLDLQIMARTILEIARARNAY